MNCHFSAAVLVVTALATVLAIQQALSSILWGKSISWTSLFKIILLCIACSFTWLVVSFAIYLFLALGCTDGYEGLDGRLLKLTFWLPFSITLSWWRLILLPLLLFILSLLPLLSRIAYSYYSLSLMLVVTNIAAFLFGGAGIPDTPQLNRTWLITWFGVSVVIGIIVRLGQQIGAKRAYEQSSTNTILSSTSWIIANSVLSYVFLLLGRTIGQSMVYLPPDNTYSHHGDPLGSLVVLSSGIITIILIKLFALRLKIRLFEK